MRHLLLVLLLYLPFPVLSQTYEPPPGNDGPAPPEDEGSSILERNAEALLNDLFNDLQPHMDAIGRELGGKLSELGPVLDDLGNMVDDIRNYQAPERLANGDIVIRRKPGAPPPPPISRELQDLAKPAPKAPPDDDANPAPAIPPPSDQIEL